MSAGGFGISPFHFGRAVVPALVTRTFKGQCVRGDLDFQRLEKARSGLAELCAQWEASIRAGTQQKTWFHACRRLALVDDVWLRLPEEVPSLGEVQNLLGSVRAYIDSRNQRVRYHDLQTWRHRMLASQADRFRWAQAKYVPWQSVDDTPACFDKVESVWRSILHQHDIPPVASRAAATCAVPASPLVSRLSQVNLLDITGSQLRVAVQRISAHSACGADG